MATGEGDSMAPDEMYLMLQADMVSTIKQFFFIPQLHYSIVQIQC